MEQQIAYYHLPGLFEFYELYRRFLELRETHREYFYDWCEIGSIYGAPADCLWGGGRVGFGEDRTGEVLQLLDAHRISARLTFSNSLLTASHLSDAACNRLCRQFADAQGEGAGIIVASELLLGYLRERYPDFYYVSSTTKVITDFDGLRAELSRPEFSYVVPDFRLNHALPQLAALPQAQKDKVEFLCNECCAFSCTDRKACYEAVSKKSLGEDGEHVCRHAETHGGYRFSAAMQNPGFIGLSNILETYLPMGFSNFKIEGRGLGSAVVLEFLLYYMTKPEHQLAVREAIYLDSMLDLF